PGREGVTGGYLRGECPHAYCNKQRGPRSVCQRTPGAHLRRMSNPIQTLHDLQPTRRGATREPPPLIPVRHQQVTPTRVLVRHARGVAVKPFHVRRPATVQFPVWGEHATQITWTPNPPVPRHVDVQRRQRSKRRQPLSDTTQRLLWKVGDGSGSHHRPCVHVTASDRQ